MPEWLPDNPCSEEAHQMVFNSTDGDTEQTKIISYMSGYFEGEAHISLTVSESDTCSLNHNCKPRVGIESKISQMAGFFDAEGCITFPTEMDSTWKSGYSCYPKVRAGQNQNGTLLEEIFKTYCSRLNITYSTYKRNPQSSDENPSMSCRVYGPDNVRKFLTPLLPLLYEKRRQAVIMLREILPRYEDGVHLTKEGFIEMMKWKRELDREKPMGDDDRKYTVEYFEDLWRDEIESQQRLDDNWRSESDAGE
jgi:hypothetical protein